MKKKNKIMDHVKNNPELYEVRMYIPLKGGDIKIGYFGKDFFGPKQTIDEKNYDKVMDMKLKDIIKQLLT